MSPFLDQICVLFLLLCLYLPKAEGFGTGQSILKAPDWQADSTLDVLPSGDLSVKTITQMLEARSPSDDKFFENARLALKHHESTPTCAHAATIRLLGKCKALPPDSTSHDSAKSLEDEKSLYAMALAICETQDAKLSSTSSCRSALSVHATQQHTDKLPSIDSKALNYCIKDCKKAHYSWTSYSNRLQEAKMLCDPSRLDVQRQELLDTYRIILDSPRETKAMLEEYLRDNAHFLNLQQSEFQQKLNAMLEVQVDNNQQLSREWRLSIKEILDNAKTSSKHQLAQASNDVATLREIITSLANAAQEATTGIALRKDVMLNQWHARITEIQQGSDVALETIGRTILMAQNGEIELQTLQQTNLENSHALSLSLNGSATSAMTILAMQQQSIGSVARIQTALDATINHVNHVTQLLENAGDALSIFSELIDLAKNVWRNRLHLVREFEIVVFTVAVSIMLLLLRGKRSAALVLSLYAVLRLLHLWSSRIDHDKIKDIVDLQQVINFSIAIAAVLLVVQIILTCRAMIVRHLRKKNMPALSTSGLPIYQKGEYQTRPSEVKRFRTDLDPAKISRSVRASTVPPDMA